MSSPESAPAHARSPQPAPTHTRSPQPAPTRAPSSTGESTPSRTTAEPLPTHARSTSDAPAAVRPVGAVESRPVAQAALWIGTLLQQFPELARELVPGRGAPAFRASGPSAPGPAERSREERADALLLQQRHGLVAPGYSAAPLRLHISDTIRDLTDGVVELEEAVRDRLGLPRARRAPVPERLRRIAALLDAVAADPVLAAHVRDETRRMARRCARALGDTETVVRISGRCPWCDSVSLRAFPDRHAVLCVNPACRCADPDCGCHDDPAYRHTWDEGEWERR
ncbi:hypothetical protein ABZ464_06065 [Streptomyces sp. NPDC005820]|uniref:hypothetical protein n=1 Tax=Streptomyces sp. NPDC005820 TaxID=3157069 RepID=UPI0033DFAB00